MRVDVVLRYIGVVMLFIAMFMLLSAGISYLSGMDSAFYPLLLSSLLTALLGAFPLIFVGKREQITNKDCCRRGAAHWFSHQVRTHCRGRGARCRLVAPGRRPQCRWCPH